jgi:hypothetical protein
MSAAPNLPTDYGRAKAVECLAIVGGVHDPVAAAWDSLAYTQRLFWLKACRLPGRLANVPWQRMEGDAHCVIKNNLYRAGRLADAILAGTVQPGN